MTPAQGNYPSGAPAAGYSQPPAGPQYPPPAAQYQQQQQYPPEGYPGQQGQQVPYAQAPPATKATYAQQPAVGVPQGTTYALAGGLQPQPIPGMPVRGPVGSPPPGHALIGYEVCHPETGCCKCEGLSATGWLVVILALLFFWPAAFIPCCMPECYEAYQRPVYGPKAA